ncbi:ASKHA domain-containing protein [Microaceticoccus formicicus]|uniref:ASKHA domain-containing protein n=1 Tax=Microaceticoccus formicicus TaxID=3118105 RepID=UPI003CD0451F|nr:ASKHA domain-containing protein [Peptoniphilaceae bacterium AMB_02]
MKIKIVNTGLVIESEKGNLLDILIENQIFVNNPCNGRGTCGKCKVKIESAQEIKIDNADLRLLKDHELREGIRLACTHEVDSDITVTTLEEEKGVEVLTSGYIPDFSIDKSEGYGIAVDIGTTTIALGLYNLKNGKQLGSSSMINPQKKFGLDVLTRITYEIEKGKDGIEEIQKVTVKGINHLIDNVLNECNIIKENVKSMVVSANCTMVHMLLGVDASSLGRYPFNPAFVDAQELQAKDIGLDLPKTILYCIPQVSAFVGGDIVSGVYVSELHMKKGNILFIDIGTNGEIVLAKNGKLYSCSCAAGPALEGMNISHGMRAADGAIENVEITEKEIKLEIIGDSMPIGLCGSGILAAVREAIKTGIITKSGVFIKPEKLDDGDYRRAYIRMNGAKRELVLLKEPEIVVTQRDIRQIQLAKGAILSGIVTLLRDTGLEENEIDEVYISGQFGSHLPAESIAQTGIIPVGLMHKIKYLGNSSISGAFMALMSKVVRTEMEALANNIEYMELATTKDYEEVFRDACMFPEIG